MAAASIVYMRQILKSIKFIIYVQHWTAFVQSLLPEKRELQEIINPEFSEIKYKQKRHSPARGTVIV